MPVALKLLDTEAKKVTHTSLDTIGVTPDSVKKWKNPPFQRPLRINYKVLQLAQQVKEEGGIIPGVLTLGILGRDEYLLDGQHRREAFIQSGCTEGYVDVRRHIFDSMADMGREFVNLNSQIVRMRPDDILRGLEGDIDGLRVIRKECPFVGYDMIRRSENSPVLSMATLLRCWFGSLPEVPSSSGMSALDCANGTTKDEGEEIAAVLKLCIAAWGKDAAYQRLWSALNLTLVFWLYRRMVVGQHSSRTQKLTKDLFQKCLMSLSAATLYVDWLQGRNLSERDRTPAYNRIKGIFVQRIFEETEKKPLFPKPEWVHS